jgi:hypothetical protein
MYNAGGLTLRAPYGKRNAFVYGLDQGQEKQKQCYWDQLSCVEEGQK